MFGRQKYMVLANVKTRKGDKCYSKVVTTNNIIKAPEKAVKKLQHKELRGLGKEDIDVFYVAKVAR